MVAKRQARGERRMAEILDAAGRVFAESGYEKATTNAIAAAAGISPGSLYQFFGNKEAIAAALAERFVSEMHEAHTAALTGHDVSAMDWRDILDRTVDPILAFNVANPGFKALFARPDMPPGLAAAAEPIQAALLGRVAAIITAKAPGLAEADRARTARVAIQVFQAMLPLVLAAEPGERPAVVEELKKVLYGYLAPLSQ
ncbi:TetR/AcrR family transcriptional regulator [Dactylosporangium fulvum]|uniref:TetR/AcrR family transcriptional regulator n=1 Tax=Dactylosporangium fulvum TaxID=53359 RepID=A0ABY5W611_9ACTN|nr:TetR/AcrR family transcriptional regulator [Dactylosporangium fulvum]UWP84825.1 TetR/AcrR family transcriptional regulator [Dactylosporangium fulvum]